MGFFQYLNFDGVDLPLPDNMKWIWHILLELIETRQEWLLHH
jgi:hypothetical protein